MRMLLCLLGAIFLIASMTACEKEDAVQHDTNLPPRVSVTSGPEEGTTSVYTVHIFWHGWDDDGYVASYEFAWDDTAFGNWMRTTRTDSVFKVRIDAAGQVQRHTFYVKAIDNGGKRSPMTAERTFFARTESPYLKYLGRVGGCYFGPDAPPDSSCPGSKVDSIPLGLPVRFVWSGLDPDGPHSSLRYKYALDGVATDWLSDTTTHYSELESGSHKFSVTVRDEVGSESVAEDYSLVYNLDPKTEFLSISVEGMEIDWQDDVPDTIPYDHKLVFSWTATDPELYVWTVGYSMDGEAFNWSEVVPRDTMSTWYDSKEPSTSVRYVDPQPNARHGNRPHEFRVGSIDAIPLAGTDRDTSGRVESTPVGFTFWYNHPPISSITFPAEGDTVGPDFEVRWVGDDSKDNLIIQGGMVEEYLYSLNKVEDPYASSLRLTSDTVMYFSMDPADTSQVNKWYQFKLRSKDNAGTWEITDRLRTFYVLDH